MWETTEEYGLGPVSNLRKELVWHFLHELPSSAGFVEAKLDRIKQLENYILGENE